MAGYETKEVQLKDSGDRTKFETGAQRDRQRGKGMPSLVPAFVIWLVSRIYEDGAYKYSARNWEKGMPLTQYIDSAERHLAKLKDGLRDEPHALQVIWNMIGYVYTAILIKLGLRPSSLNDMPNPFGEAEAAEPLSQYEYSSMMTYLGDKKYLGESLGHDVPQSRGDSSGEEERDGHRRALAIT